MSRGKQKGLKPITGGSKMRHFLAFDLEWRKGEKGPSPAFNCDVWYPEVRCAGIHDGTEYRLYRTVNEFLEAELRGHNAGKWFYAHAGGLADMMFIMERLIAHPDYRIDCSFSGSSAIIVNVTRGRYKWTFIDSYWLIRKPLKEIAKSIGMEKGTVESWDAPWAELVEYNQLDCEILWKAIFEFQARIVNLGGQLQMTQASSAMWLFKARFLKQEIRTNNAVNDVTREAYAGGRTEPFEAYCHDAEYWDINSCYAHGMMEPVPGSMIEESRQWRRDKPSIVEATVTVPEGSYIPPLHVWVGTGIYFPTGTWRGYYTGVDLELLESAGGTIEKVHGAAAFEPLHDMAEYADTLYNLRKNTTDKVDREVYKLLLNSLYGKFAERALKTSLLVHPAKTPDVHLLLPHSAEVEPDGPQVGIQMVFAGVYAKSEIVDVAHEHVPISAYITARGRASLWHHMNNAERVYYCDTDGFACNDSRIEQSNELGGLKREMMVREGVFLNAKTYTLRDADGNEDRVRTKGISLRPDLHMPVGDGRVFGQLTPTEKEQFSRVYETECFLALLNGQKVEQRKFGRMWETFQRSASIAEFAPTERSMLKGLTWSTRPKRAWLQSGGTRPWTVGELGRPWAQERARVGVLSSPNLDGAPRISSSMIELAEPEESGVFQRGSMIEPKEGE